MNGRVGVVPLVCCKEIKVYLTELRLEALHENLIWKGPELFVNMMSSISCNPLHICAGLPEGCSSKARRFRTKRSLVIENVESCKTCKMRGNKIVLMHLKNERTLS